MGHGMDGRDMWLEGQAGVRLALRMDAACVEDGKVRWDSGCRAARTGWRAGPERMCRVFRSRALGRLSWPWEVWGSGEPGAQGRRCPFQGSLLRLPDLLLPLSALLSQMAPARDRPMIPPALPAMARPTAPAESCAAFLPALRVYSVREILSSEYFTVSLMRRAAL